MGKRVVFGKRVVEITTEDIESMLNIDGDRFAVRAVTADNVMGRVLVTVDDLDSGPVHPRDEPRMLSTHLSEGRLKVDGHRP